jgi:hypothetical protein
VLGAIYRVCLHNVGAQLKAEILLLHPTLRNNYGGDGVVLPNVANSADSLLESYAGPCIVEEEISSAIPQPMDQPATANLGTELGVAFGAGTAAESILDWE